MIKVDYELVFGMLAADGSDSPCRWHRGKNAENPTFVDLAFLNVLL